MTGNSIITEWKLLGQGMCNQAITFNPDNIKEFLVCFSPSAWGAWVTSNIPNSLIPSTGTRQITLYYSPGYNNYPNTATVYVTNTTIYAKAVANGGDVSSSSEMKVYYK